MNELKLGLQMGYWGAAPDPKMVNVAQEAEKLGYDALFTAEAWGSDAFTPLTWIAAHTKKIRVGTGIAQLSARAPTATAMAALTLDHLSGGRMILGLGVSGPQVVEGWYGGPFGKPLARTRAYVDIVQQVLRREQPVTSESEHYPLPFTGAGAWGLGKPLKSITHPLRSDLPIFLGSEGPKNVALTAEIADGWLPLFYSPYRQEVYASQIADAKPGFEIMQGISVVVNDNVEQALEPVRHHLALYIGGMGAQTRNFHNELVQRMGFADEALKIQDLYLAGKKSEAAAAVPVELADEISLVGPEARIKDRLQAWRESPITSLLVSTRDLADLRTFARLVLG
ncbi:MAG: LLM class F420-dependent oxidoreductase [Gammaproteobacteria bacterium]